LVGVSSIGGSLYGGHSVTRVLLDLPVHKSMSEPGSQQLSGTLLPSVVPTYMGNV